MLEFIKDNWLLLFLLALGVSLFFNKKEKKSFNHTKNDFHNTEEDKPKVEFPEQLKACIGYILVTRYGMGVMQIIYTNPWFFINTSHGNFECLIRESDIILRKGDKECVSQIDVDEITQALKQIGVLKGMRMKKQFGRTVFVFCNPSGLRPPSLKSTGP